MKESFVFDKLPAKFCSLVEEYRIELAKRNPILDLDVNLSGITICGIHETILISEKFGFIKRLVDNDKIDIMKLDSRIALSEFNKTERFLMALAISDTPIEDLISYLKIS